MSKLFFLASCLSSALFFTKAGFAWNPFTSNNGVEEVQLSAAEMAAMKINAGWSNDDPKTLLFEIHSDNTGPIQCASISVELKDGGHASKSLVPKLFVPPKSSKFVSVPNVMKGTMKSYSVGCTCYKKSAKGECVHPLKN